MPGKFLITVIYRRRVCSELVLSEMLEINECSIGKAITGFLARSGDQGVEQ